MESCVIPADEILRSHGDVESLKIENAFEFPDEECGFSIITPSQYYSLHTAPDKLKKLTRLLQYFKLKCTKFECEI